MSEKPASETTESPEAASVAVADGHAHQHGPDCNHDHDHGHGHDHGDDDYSFVEDPTFTVEYKGECQYEVGVVIPAVNRVKKAEEMFEELKDEAQLPGFRRGKAPKALVQSKFAKAVKGEVFQKLVGGAFQKLVRDEELQPLSMPDIDGIEEAIESGDDTDIAFTFKFEVAPRCTLGDYTGLKAERPVLEVSDKDVQTAIDEMRTRMSYFESVEEGASQEGDQVVINFTGTIDGEPFAGGSAENYPYFIGSKRFFPEFEAALVGVAAGGETTAEVAFPEDYHGKDVAGKTALFAIAVNEIKRRKLPEIDDSFAQEAGFENVADMREKVAADLREGANAQSDRVLENRLIRQIVETSTFEIPASLIESSATEYYRQEIRRLVELRVPPAEVQKRDEAIRAEAREAAIENIKAYVAVAEIGVAEKITIDESDFEEEARAIQQRTGMKLDVIQRFLTQSEQRSNYEDRIFRRKALQIVKNAAVVSNVTVSQEELDKQDDEASDEE